MYLIFYIDRRYNKGTAKDYISVQDDIYNRVYKINSETIKNQIIDSLMVEYSENGKQNEKVFIFLTSGLISLNGQNKTHLQDIDGIAAIVDDNLVLLSDINQSLAMAVFQNNWDPSKDIEKINNLKSQITQNLLIEKLYYQKSFIRFNHC